jgi:nucleoside-diphosphate-sugar epimerase
MAIGRRPPHGSGVLRPKAGLARRGVGFVCVRESPVLVTGATGMVGGAIVRALLQQGRAVRVLARAPERARALFGGSVEVVAGDLRVPASLRRACDGVREIHHAAAALGFRDDADTTILDTNVEGTRHLLAAARASGVRRLVFTSSVAVYGDHLPLGVREDTPLHPSGAYAVSKARAEALVRDATDGTLCCMILRPCVVYGPGDRYFLPQAVATMRLPVVPLPDGGRHVIDLVHADDVAAAHLLVMRAGQPGEAYNVTDGGGYRTGDLIRWMAEACRRRPWRPSVSSRLAYRLVPWIRLAGRAARLPELARLAARDVPVFFGDYHFDISKIAALGFAPRVQTPTALPAALRALA